jgi:sugar transferase (PEP-CTERM/EpsH1 system associated)
VENILLLVHRIPYPPNKGDKIRSYHLLKYLARRYQVHLGTFVDDPNDWQYVKPVKGICASTCFAPLNPRVAKLRGATALLRNRPLTVDYYKCKEMTDWVAQCMRSHQITKIVVFSSAMAQFATPYTSARRIADFVDVDSDKWAQYANNKRPPMSWLYRHESKRLLAYEREITQSFDASLFVSEAEAELFKQLSPENAEKIGSFNNGVDVDYFSPARQYAAPYDDETPTIVFTGAMDYWPNVDAVVWFANEVMPLVLKRHPAALFYVVGTRPSAEVKALASLPGVRVTGAVPDVRPYLAHASVAVAPLRVARGIQNKVLEAMAMAKPVVVSPQALEGIDAAPGTHLLLAEDAGDYAKTISYLIDTPDPSLGRAARERVESRYGWENNLAPLGRLLGAEQGEQASRQKGKTQSELVK